MIQYDETMHNQIMSNFHVHEEPATCQIKLI